MLVYRIAYTHRSEKQFLALPAAIRARIAPDVNALAFDPRPAGCRKMAGWEETYRIRVGDYRVLYEIHDQVLVVQVVRVGHRRDVYR